MKLYKNCNAFVMAMALLLLSGCGKQSLSNQVKLKTDTITLGENIQLEDLFETPQDITVAIRNKAQFDNKKPGTYAIDVVLERDEQQESKSYMVKVVDKEKPNITLKQTSVSIYEGEKFVPEKYVTVTDNSGETINAKIDQNNINTEIPGEYTINYVAKDSSNNESTQELKVIVKKKYSYKELTTFCKSLLKQKQYARLKMFRDTTKKSIYIVLGDKYIIPFVKVSGEIYRMQPYLSIYKNSAGKWVCSYVFDGCLSSSKKYIKPGTCYITSENGKEKSSNWSYETSYDGDYVQCFDVDYSYVFHPKQTEKITKILGGNNIKCINYENVTNDKYSITYKKSNVNTLHQLKSFCEQITGIL